MSADPTGRAAGPRVVDLRADSRREPLGTDAAHPRLSWRIESAGLGVRQVAYRILVASAPDRLHSGDADLWDSGRVESGATIGIRYGGAPLGSRRRSWWRVQVWDDVGATATSEPTWWETGLRDRGDWVAEWLAAEDPVRRADREAGLRWVWDAFRETGGVRRFRIPVELPSAAVGGELLAVANDWSSSTQILGVRLDGRLVAGPGERTDTSDRALVGTRDLDDLTARRATTGPLVKGPHLVEVEVDAAPATDPAAFGRIPGLAVFARFDLEDGGVLRAGSGPGTRVSSARGDAGWQPASPVDLDDYQPWPAEPAMRFRHEFDVAAPVATARLYATALGAYEARLNGRRVGDALLTPEISQYADRVMYQTFDVTALVVPGRNALGLTVADGWFASSGGRFAWARGPRRVLAQLELVLADGTRMTVGTGPGWRVGRSPILRSAVKGGEVHDLRPEQPGWDSPGFADADWDTAAATDGPPYRPTAQPSPPLRALETIPPHEISEPRTGVRVVDFGLNFVGWCRLRVRGAAGTEVLVRHGELLNDDGTVDQSSQGDPVNLLRTDRFVLPGGPDPVVLEPRFAYRAFQYAEVTGLTGPLDPADVEGVLVGTDLDVTGSFDADVPLLTRLWEAMHHTHRSNLVGVPTDNNTREARGWMNDAVSAWDSAAFGYDLAAFATRYLDAIADGQRPDGAFPKLAPEARHNNAFFNGPGATPGWGEAGIILPWLTWQRYGELAIVERHWDAMRRHVAHVQGLNPDFVWRTGRGQDAGDWLELGMAEPGDAPVTPLDLVGTAYWAHAVDLLARMTRAIGRDADATELAELHARIRDAFAAEFVAADGVVGSGSQSGYVFALAYGLVPAELRDAASARLADDVRDRGGRLTTGTLATPHLLDVLADGGHPELAYDLLLRTEHPSWGYAIERGSRSIWEYWNGEVWGTRNSRNQLALACAGGFLFRRVAGISPAAPGFERVDVEPLVDPRVGRVSASYRSVRGLFASAWRQEAETFVLDLTVPPTASARVRLPDGRVAQVASGTHRFAVAR